MPVAQYEPLPERAELAESGAFGRSALQSQPKSASDGPVVPMAFHDSSAAAVSGPAFPAGSRKFASSAEGKRMGSAVWFPWLEANQGFLSLLALVSALTFALFEQMRANEAEARRRSRVAAELKAIADEYRQAISDDDHDKLGEYGIRSVNDFVEVLRATEMPSPAMTHFARGVAAELSRMTSEDEVWDFALVLELCSTTFGRFEKAGGRTIRLDGQIRKAARSG
jgi:hypothetical protein